MQTDETVLFPSLKGVLKDAPCKETEENGVRLDARGLSELRGGLPAFPRAPRPPAAAAVAVVGAPAPL